jgi:broad specificity phosphatase PhoE
LGIETRWWWVRHAPVVGHGGKIYGQGDIDCDVSDTASFEGLAAKLPKGAVWLTSHLSRTTKTANAILQAGGASPANPEEFIVEHDLAEQCFGDWQKCSWDELHAKGGPEYKAFWINPGYQAPPGGESFADLIARTSTVIGRFNDWYPDRDIVAVAHGGTIRAAIALAMKLEPVIALSVMVANLTITRVDFVSDGLYRGQGGVWRVEGINLPPI